MEFMIEALSWGKGTGNERTLSKTPTLIDSADIIYCKGPYNLELEGANLCVMSEGSGHGIVRQYSIATAEFNSLVSQMKTARMNLVKFPCNIIRDCKHVPEGEAFINADKVNGVYYSPYAMHGSLLDRIRTTSIDFGTSHSTVVLGWHHRVRSIINNARRHSAYPKAEIY